MVQLCRSIAESARFQNLVTIVILIAGIIVGLETSPAIIEKIGGPLHFIDKVILAIFTVEAITKIGAEGRQPWRYFRDPWNVFDFFIVAVCYMPVGGQYVAVLRLARLLRVLKLVRALPKLQVLVGALLKSIPSMGYVALLLSLLFYVYSVAGVFIFGQNDPRHFGSLPIAMVSLFRLVTGDAWTDVMYINMFGCERFGYQDFTEMCTHNAAHPIFGAVFFISFMLLGSMVILNLFIGVIMGGMEEARAENEEADRMLNLQRDGAPSVEDDMNLLVDKVSELQGELMNLRVRLRKAEAAREEPGA
jgi:voltage-gated sodium channel